jgi:glutathione S-transferase
MALHELDLPYEAVLVDRATGGLRHLDYLSLNPQGLLPVLAATEQDAPIFETGAILLHLADREGRLAPADPRARGRLLKWLFFLSNTLHADLRVLFYAERYTIDPASAPALRGGIRARIDGHLRLLDWTIAEAGGHWLLGSELTILDFYLATCVRWAQIYPPGEALTTDAIAPLTALATMLETLANRPAIREACGREGIHGPLFLAPAMPGSIV